MLNVWAPLLTCLQYLPTIAERKAAFGEFCKESVGKKKGAAAAAGGAGIKGKGAGSSSKAAPAVAAPPPAKTPATEFERLLEEIQAACSSSIVPAPAAGEEEGQLLPAWDARLHLEDLQERWGEDPRWQRCPAEQRQVAFDQLLAPVRAAARKQHEADYRALLREAGVTGASRWSRTKDELSADPRYLALPRDDRCGDQKGLSPHLRSVGGHGMGLLFLTTRGGRRSWTTMVP